MVPYTITNNKINQTLCQCVGKMSHIFNAQPPFDQSSWKSQGKNLCGAKRGRAQGSFFWSSMHSCRIANFSVNNNARGA